MRTKLLIILFFAVFILSSCTGKTQKQNVEATPSTADIEVIQFHSERRCMTCQLIEKLTKETVQNLPNVIFKTVNVDESANEKLAEEFEATGTALFVYQPNTGKKKDMTEFAFMNAKSNPEEFKKGLKAEIENFSK